MATLECPEHQERRVPKEHLVSPASRETGASPASQARRVNPDAMAHQVYQDQKDWTVRLACPATRATAAKMAFQEFQVPSDLSDLPDHPVSPAWTEGQAKRETVATLASPVKREKRVSRETKAFPDSRAFLAKKETEDTMELLDSQVTRETEGRPDCQVFLVLTESEGSQGPPDLRAFLDFQAKAESVPRVIRVTSVDPAWMVFLDFLVLRVTKVSPGFPARGDPQASLPLKVFRDRRASAATPVRQVCLVRTATRAPRVRTVSQAWMVKREMPAFQASQDPQGHLGHQDFPAKMDSLEFRELRVTRVTMASRVFQAW